MIFGLEPEDLVLVGFVSGAILFVIDAIPAVLVGAILWVGLSRVKNGKPPGYLFELLYRSGAQRWVPGFGGTPHLLPAGRRELDAFPGDDDETVRSYWAGRSRLD